MEIDWDDELITWITSTRKFTATFAEFGTACQINYERTQNGEYVGTRMLYRLIPVEAFISQINTMVMGL